MYYINENVKELYRIFDQNSRKGYLRLDLNENPIGLGEDFVREVLDEIDQEFISQYPETGEFQEFLANHIGVKTQELCLTNGSAEAIRHIIEIFTKPGGNIVGVSPTYAMYEVYSKMYGRNFIPVNYDDKLNISVDSIIEKIDDNTDLVVLLNPNNPIGNVYTDEEVKKVIDAAKEHFATVLIDEAYYYFCPNTMINFALENEHVFLTRTFSKLFSLAGLRLGYVVGKSEGVNLIQKMCTPHNVGAFGIKFARAIIEKEGMIEELVKGQREGKSMLVNKLQQNGYNVKALEGNYIFIETKTDPTKLVKELKEKKKILIKNMSNIANGKYIRISTGTKPAMDRFYEALIELDK